MRKKKLPKKQKKVLEFLKDFNFWRIPTMETIVEKVGISDKKSCFRILKELRERERGSD